MPNRTHPDNPATPEAHVPWESIDDDVDESDQGEELSQAQSSNNSATDDSGADQSEDEALAFGAVEADDPGQLSRPPSTGGGWTVPILCAGVALIACCALIPQADANRRMTYDRQELQRDLETVEKQIAVNDEFLKQVGQDPTLAERLAQRQMKVVPQGTQILELRHAPSGSSMSPFQLVNVPPPPPLPPYKPIGGLLARICYDAHTRLYLIGIALGMVATGLVLGSAPEK
jgi:hypothetical protein